MPRLFFAVVITKITHNIVEAGNGEQCARMKHWIGGQGTWVLVLVLLC